MKRLLCIFAALVILTTCRPFVGYETEVLSPVPVDFSMIFETFWRGMDRNYLYWSEEPSPLWEPVFDELGLSTEDREALYKYPEAFWDQIYDKFKPMFADLGTHVYTGEEAVMVNSITARVYLELITAGLRDGHFRLQFHEPFRSFFLSPAVKNPAALSGLDQKTIDRIMSFEPEFGPVESSRLKRQRAQNPVNAERVFLDSDLSGSSADAGTFDYVANVLTQRYFTTPSSGYRVSLTWDSSGNMNEPDIRPYNMDVVHLNLSNSPMDGSGLPRHIKIVKGKIPVSDGHVLYFQYNISMLSLIEPLLGPGNIIDAFFNDLNDPALKGLIMDIRSNGGGSDIGYIWGRMINSPLTYAYSRSKSGEGRLDYTPWIPIQVMPAPNTEKRLRNTNIPIRLLVNRATLSAAEFSAMIVKAMPNGKVIGTRTAGASSSTRDVIIHNAGSFYGGPLWAQAYGSVAQYRLLDGTIPEGFGIDPDIYVEDDWGAFYSGTDKQLEAAINSIQ